MLGALLVLGLIHRILVNDDATAVTALALGGERFYQAGAEALAGHLHQTQRRHLGDLVAGAIAAQGFLQTAQHQILVFRQDHIDKVHDDHAAEIAQTHLAHDFFGRLEVIAGYRFLQVAARTGELSGIDVDDGHGLGAVDDQRAAGGQPYLARERLMQLLINAVGIEGILLAVVLGTVAHHAVRKVWRHGIHISTDGVEGTLAIDDELSEVFVEEIAHHLDEHVRLFIHGHRFGALGGFFFLSVCHDVLPPAVQAVDVGSDCLFRYVFGGGADDRSTIAWNHVAEDILQALALWGRQLAGNAGAAPARYVDQVAASKGNLGGKARALMTDGILSHLHQHLVTGFQGVFYLAGAPVQLGLAPVDFTGVEHAVSALSNVHESRLHGRQHVLDAAQVDIANERGLGFGGHEVLDQQVIL